jgi:predicted PurR-regulated permease PerM
MRSIPQPPDGATRVQRALRWAIFLAAASVVGGVCVAILRPFANVIAWSAVLAVLCYPLQQRLVRRTGRVALSAFMASVVTVLACVVPLLVAGGIAVNECVALGHSLQHAFRTEGEPLTRAAAVWARITGSVGLGEAAMPAWIQQHMNELVRGAGQYTITIAAGLFDAFHKRGDPYRSSPATLGE